MQTNGNKTKIGFWSHRSNAFAKIGSILELSSLKVDKFPDEPPRNLSTTGYTRFKVLTGELHKKIWEPITETDGILQDYTVDVVSDIRCYKSCHNCKKKVFETNARTCSKCSEVLTSLRDDFRYSIYLTKENQNEELQGFRKNLDEDGKIMLDGFNVTDADEVEDQLNNFFGGKEVDVEYTVDGDQKTIEKISLKKIPVDSNIKEDEPDKKKLKKEEK